MSAELANNQRWRPWLEEQLAALGLTVHPSVANFVLVEFERDGAPWVRFHTRFDDDAHDKDVECPVFDRRAITNTSGVPEVRIVIRTKFRIAKRLWQIDLSLTERTEMKSRMIVGRTALRRHSILVHPGKRDILRKNGLSPSPNMRTPT